MYIYPKFWKPVRIPNVYLYGKQLKFVTSKKYLGYIMSSTRDDELDMRRQLKSFYARANFIVRKFSHCSKKVKCTLFRSFLYNVYCLNVWCNYSTRMMHTLKVAYNNTMRLVFDLRGAVSISNICVSSDILNFSSLHRKLLYTFNRRIVESHNTLIRICIDSDAYFRSNFWRNYRIVTYSTR